jgi:DNA-binding MarR family transcriptional regulator
MVKDGAPNDLDIADELLDVVTSLLRQVRVGLPGEADDGVQETPEWRDISELRATSGQVRLLRVLVRHGRCTMQDLAEQLGVAPPTVTAMIKRMLAQEVVERVRDEQDWRVVWISPTERGRRAVELYDQFRRANLQRRLALLRADELLQLRAVLPVLKHVVEIEI